MQLTVWKISDQKWAIIPWPLCRKREEVATILFQYQLQSVRFLNKTKVLKVLNLVILAQSLTTSSNVVSHPNSVELVTSKQANESEIKFLMLIKNKLKIVTTQLVQEQAKQKY